MEGKNGMVIKWRIDNKFPDIELMASQLSGHLQTPGFRGEYEKENGPLKEGIIDDVVDDRTE